MYSWGIIIRINRELNSYSSMYILPYQNCFKVLISISSSANGNEHKYLLGKVRRLYEKMCLMCPDQWMMHARCSHNRDSQFTNVSMHSLLIWGGI